MKKSVLLTTALAAILTLASCGGGIYEEEGTYTGRISIVDGTALDGTTWDPTTAANEIAREFNTHGNALEVILSNNDGMALGVISNSTYKQYNVPIFGVDALADAIAAIKDGTMQGTIKNDSYTQAGVTLQLAKNLVEGKTNLVEGITEDKYPGIYTNDEGKVEIEEGTKALRVHHIKVTKDNVNDLVTPETVQASTIGDTSSDMKFFALTYNNTDPNMSGLWKPGFNDYGKQLGVKVDWVDAKNDDNAATSSILPQAATQDYDAFLINPVAPDNLTTYINAIRSVPGNETKPIIVWNREGSKEAMAADANTYYVGIESAEGGRLQGEMAAEYIMANGGISKFDKNGDGKLGYVVIRGEKAHPDAEARTVASPEYFENTLVELNKE